MLCGVAASQGYGIGTAVVIHATSLDYSAVRFTTVENEIDRLHIAVDSFVSQTQRLAADLRHSAGDAQAEILDGHIVMLNDPFMLSQMQDCIASGSVAEYAVDTVCNMFVDMFSNVDDDLTRQRASDVRDIRDSLLRLLLGVASVDISSVAPGSVLVAKDFTPSMTSQINPANVTAIVTEVGGITSHSAILARAMGIPAVLSVVDAVDRIADGELVIADGFKGRVLINPSSSDLDYYTRQQRAYLAEKESLLDYFARPTVTKSGVAKKVYGNIGRAEDVQNVIQNGGEGIGLFRTEFLFMHRNTPPTEQEQYEAYSTVAKALDGREVIIRTLDIGGDKAIDYLSIVREDNPFLGHRAIRYCLDNVPLFKQQIRAILRAGVFGNIRLMLPLVTTVDEVRVARSIISDCEQELKHEGVRYRSVPVGAMIETPSAALISDLLAREVDFFSIGTNDLTGYVMAVDRGNAAVQQLYNTHQPAVLRAIEMTIKNAKRAGIMVGMCGESAADERLIPQLIEWGLDEFSVTPSSILQTRKTICQTK